MLVDYFIDLRHEGNNERIVRIMKYLLTSQVNIILRINFYLILKTYLNIITLYFNESNSIGERRTWKMGVTERKTIFSISFSFD